MPDADVEPLIHARNLTKRFGKKIAVNGIDIAVPEGGVVVMVGLTKYNGVGEVPDPQVQAMIRAAIAEWENRYTPGI